MFAEPAVSGRGREATKESEPSIEARGGTYAVSAFLAIGIHAGVLFGGFGDLPFEPAEYGVVRGDSAVEVELIAAPPVPKDEPVEPVESHEPAKSATANQIDEIEEESEQVPTPPPQPPEAEQEMPKPEPMQEAKLREARSGSDTEPFWDGKRQTEDGDDYAERRIAGRQRFRDVRKQFLLDQRNLGQPHEQTGISS